jgi:hypothetical protein
MSLRAAQAGFGALVRAPHAHGKADATARRRALRGVRGLRARDAEALSALPAARIAVYHDLVLGGHQTMLRYAFGTTLSALELLKAKPPRARRAESFAATVEAFLAAPGGPATHSLRELAASFAAFLRRRFAATFRARPLLKDLLAFETAELAVELETDGPGRPANDEDLRRLAAGTLHALLRTKLRRPSYERRFAFRTDVVGALKALRADPPRATPKDLARPARAYVSLVRDPSRLTPLRHDLEADVYRDLGRFPAGEAFRAEALAAVRARRGPRGEAEDAAAARVAAELFAWLRGGLLILA